MATASTPLFIFLFSRKTARIMDGNFFTRVMIFIALNYFTAQVSCQQSRCSGIGNYCSGQFGDMKAVCKGGYCYCSGKDYDYNTCLPDAYGCKIVTDSDTALGIPLYTTGTVGKIYSCSPDSNSSQYEVHVLAVYEVINRRPPKAGNARVNIISRGKSNRPIVLVLVSYEPVKWILNIPSDITISKVILVSHYILESSVSGDVSRVKNIERIGTINSEWSTGYGSDLGGGGTVKTLKQIHKIFGVVTSFTGTYKANEWSLKLSPYNGTADNGTRTTTAILPTASPKIRRTKCLGSYCSSWGGMKAFCKDGYCYCSGTHYDYDTCLPDAYGCKIVSNSDTTYTCTPDYSSPLYEVHVLSVYEVINRRPPRAGNARVNFISRGKSNRPIVLVLVSYEAVNWILNIPSNITISKVILVSYYILESSVSGGIIRVKNIERIGTRNSEWSFGYGSDSGGGDTVKTL
ncbi:myosin light chain kinase, smooth muscle-like, partial [Paramuricea clavata]